MISRVPVLTMALFYLAWFGSALVANSSFSTFSLIFPGLLMSYLYFAGQLRPKETLYAFAIAIFGFAADTILINLGLITMVNNINQFAPIWLMSIWLSFAFSVIVFSKYLKLSQQIAALLGLFIGPLSYKSGEYLKVMEFQSAWTILVYAIFWAFYFPLILHFSKRMA